MAQELLQMVQSNPQVHGPTGIYEAYSRMYSALGVDNIESLLQPPPDMTPKPVDAGLENSGLLLGQPAQAFEQQNHEAHIEAHQSLFLTKVVKENPQIQSLIISHVMQHIQFFASQLAQQQMPPELQQRIAALQQQMQQVTPEQAQQIQQELQMMMDQMSSPILAELTNQFLSSIGQSDETDPLVAIRQQELALKDKELDMDAEQFELKQQAMSDNAMVDAQLQQRRLDVQKTIADDKLQVALDRLQQQAEFKLLELEQKMRGN